jgi:SAM-dependent methyltransferase
MNTPAPELISDHEDVQRAQTLLRLWDDQQTAYITGREERFDVMLDVLDATHHPKRVLLDLACGPGSLAIRALRRFPDLQIVAVDYDPMLLELGRHALAQYRDRITFVDVDLADPAWVNTVADAEISAVASSTALHWLSASTLTRVYRELAELLPSGGVFLNADHLRFDDGRALFRRVSERDDTRSQDRGNAAGALTWDQWFHDARSAGPWAAFADERERRFAARPPNPDLSAAFHTEALRTAGFPEAGTVWQYYDDFILLAQR